MGTKAQFWEAHIRAWRDSGLSQVAYCRLHGLDKRRLRYWRRTREAAKQEFPSLVPIVMTEPVRSEGRLELQLPNGVRAWLPCDLAPAQLGPILQALAAC